MSILYLNRAHIEARDDGLHIWVEDASEITECRFEDERTDQEDPLLFIHTYSAGEPQRERRGYVVIDARPRAEYHLDGSVFHAKGDQVIDDSAAFRAAIGASFPETTP